MSARGPALRSWFLPLAILVVALAAQAGGSVAQELLRYGRAEIAAGEAWRLLTGHVVHLGWAHCAMNLVALLLIWLLVGRFLTPRYWCLVLLVTVAGIDAGFWFLEPQLAWYVGLSGVLHGVLVAGIVAALGRGQPELLVLGILLLAKLSYEQWLGPLPGSEATAGGAVIVDAHLYGALAGGLAALPARFRKAAGRPL